MKNILSIRNRYQKHKERSLILREFSKDSGEILTICEDENQQISFHNEKNTQKI